MAKPKKPKRKPGPTAAQTTSVGQLMKGGVGLKRAIAAAGIAERTGMQWLATGREHLESGKTTTRHAKFALLVNTLQAQLVARSEVYVHRAQDLPDALLAPKDKLHNAHWILKSLARDEYGEGANIERVVQKHVEEYIEALERFMSATAYEELIVATLKLAASQDANEDA